MSRIIPTFSALIFCLLLIVSVNAEEKLECGLCGTPVTESSNRFVINDPEEGELVLGCPGCGLAVLAKMPSEQYSSARVQDFLRRTMIDAQSAWYLRGTEIGFCCSPYWLAFGSREEAEKFARGFGGEVLDFESAIKLAPEDHEHQHVH
jgi:hypothetical protein